MFLTQDSTFIIGPVAKLLGKIMDIIFTGIDAIGMPNIGLAIVLFTIVVNLLMLPLTIKQQKFSKLSAKMNPEIQAIQAKYKNKKDNDSMMAQNQEVQAVYAKYGVSPSGSCVQLLIQMPILFALYRVIYAMPAYVGKIRDAFMVLADKIISTDNAAFIQNSEVSTIANTVKMYGKNMADGNMTNGVIDVLNKLSSTDMEIISNHYGLANLTFNGELILSNETTKGLLDIYNNLFGLNIANSPQHIIKTAFAAGSYALVIGAIMIPLLSALTQWINTKLMPQTENKNNQQDAMAASMKSMNTIMPILSAWFCFTLPCGMGLYWIASAVVRSIQQVIINKHFDKIDFDELIKKNSEKSAKKIAKMKEQQERMNAYANMNTRNISQPKKTLSEKATSVDNASKVNEADVTTYTSNAKPGSMMAKANMVKDYNNRNNKN